MQRHNRGHGPHHSPEKQFMYHSLAKFSNNNLLKILYNSKKFSFNVESLKLVVTQFSCYSWDVLLHEFTSSTKTY